VETLLLGFKVEVLNVVEECVCADGLGQLGQQLRDFSEVMLPEYTVLENAENAQPRLEDEVLTVPEHHVPNPAGKVEGGGPSVQGHDPVQQVHVGAQLEHLKVLCNIRQVQANHGRERRVVPGHHLVIHVEEGGEGGSIDEIGEEDERFMLLQVQNQDRGDK